VPTLTPHHRSLVAVISLVLVLGAGAAACGIDGDKVATGETSTTKAGQTTTTKPSGPRISLPDIPPDATESTVPDPTTTGSIPEGEATPNGVTPDDLAAQLVDAGLTEDQAQCVASETFIEFDGDTIDDMVAADDLADLGGDIEQRFTGIVESCLQGG
jgi:hypothetical protein